MTIICALHQDGETWLGSDTLAVWDGYPKIVDPKWFIYNDWAIGHSGKLRVSNILQEYYKKLLTDLKSPFDFTKRCIKLFHRNQVCKHENSDYVANFGQYIILANKNQIWEIDSAFSIISTSFASSGSGWAYATGVYYIINKDDPHHIITSCLKAAVKNDVYCGGELWVQKL